MNHRTRLLALVLALAMVFSSCGRRGPEIVVEPVDLMMDQQVNKESEEADYQSPGYFAPNTGLNQSSPIAPAPARASIDDIREAQQQMMIEESYEQASLFTTIPKGDMNIGLVVGEDMLLNPFRCPYVDMMNLNMLVFESLVALDENHQPQAMLADRWEVSGDIWTFTIRPNVSFQDGSIVSADDVVASYEELMRNPSSYWYPMVNSMIEGINIKDETSVRVKGKSGYTGHMMLYAMTFPIVHRNTMESMCPVGTGPYLFVQYDGNAVQLALNSVWWRRGTNLIDTIVGICYRTVKDAVAALDRGDIDTLASEYPTASINRTLADRMAIDYSTTTYECIVPNLNKTILKDLSVRQALIYAIDRLTLGSTVYAGMVQESEVPIIPGTYLYEKQAARYNYNPERALKILYDAGWKDTNGDNILEREIDGAIHPLSLRLFTYDRGTTYTRTEAAEAIATQLKLVGFDITVETGKLQDLQKTMDEGGFDLALVAFELSEAPNLGFLLSSNGNSNFMRYKDDNMDALLREAVMAEDAEMLQMAMSKIQMKIVEELPLIGLFFRTGILTSARSVRGLRGLRRGYVLNGIATALEVEAD